MDTDPKYERLAGNGESAGTRLPKATRNKIETLLKQGTPPSEAARMTATSHDVVSGIRNHLQDTGQLDLLAFKRRTAQRLASFIDKGVNRLDQEVDQIPLGQLMLSTAIAIDKLEKLVDPTPSVNVKAELKISVDDINKLLDSNNLTIDVETKPEQPPE
jgi:hypothetical protein